MTCVYKLRRASPLGGDLILAYYIYETPISKPVGNKSCTERVGRSLEASFASSTEMLA